MTAGPNVDGTDCIIVNGFSTEWYRGWIDFLLAKWGRESIGILIKNYMQSHSY
jgi:hypothetical protein